VGFWQVMLVDRAAHDLHLRRTIHLAEHQIGIAANGVIESHDSINI
jgi:hypothetical protein